MERRNTDAKQGNYSLNHSQLKKGCGCCSAVFRLPRLLSGSLPFRRSPRRERWPSAPCHQPYPRLQTPPSLTATKRARQSRAILCSTAAQRSSFWIHVSHHSGLFDGTEPCQDADGLAKHAARLDDGVKTRRILRFCGKRTS